MNKLETRTKKKIEEILQILEGSESESWKNFIEQHEAEFEALKESIKQKQTELLNLVRKRRVITITDDEFIERTNKLQQDLYELESKILELRLKGKK